MTPVEAFTGKKPDWLRDLRAEWGEPVIVKKPKGISADLKVVGEWAIIVRRIMNGTGVLKVYLIQSRKFAHRLKFKRAKAPEWVVNALNSISVNQAVGFEDPTDNPEDISEAEGMIITVREPLQLQDLGTLDKLVSLMNANSGKAIKEYFDDTMAGLIDTGELDESGLLSDHGMR